MGGNGEFCKVFVLVFDLFFCGVWGFAEVVGRPLGGFVEVEVVLEGIAHLFVVLKIGYLFRRN